MGPPLLFDLAGRRVAVCGHKGMAGSAIMRRLAAERCEIITADRTTVDFTHEEPTAAWLARTKPDALFLAAARRRHSR
jgi:GDP-L-fucose synthase